MEGEGSGKVEVAEDKGREIKIWCGDIAGEEIDFRIFGFWQQSVENVEVNGRTGIGMMVGRRVFALDGRTVVEWGLWQN